MVIVINDNLIVHKDLQFNKAKGKSEMDSC